MQLKPVILIMGLFISFAGGAATWNIKYPRQMSDVDSRHQYPLALLEKALQETGVNFTLESTDKTLLQSKALKQLKANRDVNVVWSMTDELREQELLPVRIPIYKGLIGLRIPLVRKTNQDVFKYVKSMEKLTLFSPLSGRDWPDTKILQANGFAVVTEDEYEKLFVQLKKGAGDFFPRSVVEIWREAHTEEASLTIEPHIALHYPTAMYFFVNKKSQALARLIESGLEKLIASGEFDQLFFAAHQDSLAQSEFGKRRVFQLQNPVLPAATPLDRAELWHQPEGAVPVK